MQQRQLAGAALSFLTDGKPVKSYTLREFVGDVEVYKHTPEHLIWYASAVLNAETGKFILYTQEATRFTFDMRTGESLEVSKVGLSNPIVEKILIVMAGMTVLILAGWGLFVMRRRQPDSVRLAP